MPRPSSSASRDQSGFVLSIRQSRTISQDHTVRWEGVIYQIERKQVARGMRGACVELERRLDGSTWMHWRNSILPLTRCPAPLPASVASAAIKRRVTPVRSATEKEQARQRLLEARRKYQQSYDRMPDRPLWQALSDSPQRTKELL